MSAAGKRSDDIEALVKSDLFDHVAYGGSAGVVLSRREAARHYLEIGETKGFSAGSAFDVRFYRRTSADVAAAGGNLLLHYVREGAFEGRFGNRDDLAAIAEEVARTCPQAARAEHEDGWRLPAPGLTMLETHLAIAWRRGERLVPGFDDAFYFATYPDVRESGLVPLLHFSRIGAREKRLASPQAVAEAAAIIRSRIDEQFYISQGSVLPEIDAAEHYVTVGWRQGLDPSRRFSTGHYLETYADIRQLSIDPFIHYIAHGEREGRQALPLSDNVTRRGGGVFDRGRRTIAIAVHATSRTGAPLLALALARELARTCNIIVVVPSDDGLYPDFLAQSCLTLVGGGSRRGFELLVAGLLAETGLEALIGTSVETTNAVAAAFHAGVPSVALINEFVDYSHPAGSIAHAVLSSDVAVFPAELVAASAQAEIRARWQSPALDIRIRPQGKLVDMPAELTRSGLTAAQLRAFVGANPEVKIVLGAGSAHIRKGVDWFVQAAAAVRDVMGANVRFVWIGADYRPDADLAFSTWVRTAIDRLNLADTIFLLPEQTSIVNLFEAADLFFLSSRLDPFPNVAIDAVAAGRKLVCFAGATGIAEWIADGRIEGKAVPYGDTAAAAGAIVRLLSANIESTHNRQVAATQFSMRDYAAAVLGFVDDAVTICRTRRVMVEELAESGLFDATFNAGRRVDRAAARRALTAYVAWAARGVVPPAPRPGFSDALYRARHGLVGRPVVPFADVLAKHPAALPATHRCIVLTEQPAGFPTIPVRFHLFVTSAPAAGRLAHRVLQLRRAFDVVVTATHRDAASAVEEAVRGRDVSVSVDLVEEPAYHFDAVMAQLCNRPSRPDAVVGCFHDMLEARGDDEGRDLSAFLNDTLLGGRATTASLLRQFERDPMLSLLVAEDRFGGFGPAIDPRADDARSSLVSPPRLVSHSMFWARPAVLAPLLDTVKAIRDRSPLGNPANRVVTSEIERFLVKEVVNAGLSWASVRRLGIDRRG